VADLLGEKDDKLEEIKMRHRRQWVQFESHYDDVDNLKAFSKPSGGLLQIRAQERACVLCQRFQDAKVLQKEARRMEKMEIERGQRWAESSVERKKQNLAARQRREIELATIWFDRLILTTRQQMAVVVEADKTRLGFLDREAHLGLTFIGADGQEACGVSTPRTKESLLRFRATEPLRPLPLLPVVGLAEKCATSPSRRRRR
jgi:hypothetical protein